VYVRGFVAKEKSEGSVLNMNVAVELWRDECSWSMHSAVVPWVTLRHSLQNLLRSTDHCLWGSWYYNYYSAQLYVVMFVWWQYSSLYNQATNCLLGLTKVVICEMISDLQRRRLSMSLWYWCGGGGEVVLLFFHYD
jgi:hypothetical protein